MITKEQFEQARLNWQKASKNLFFEIITPYFIEINGIKKELFAFLPEYGSPNGTIICLTSPPHYETDSEIIQWSKENKFYYSFLNVEEFQEYDEECLNEILEDWMKYKKSR
jgi:hypothetical protein